MQYPVCVMPPRAGHFTCWPGSVHTQCYGFCVQRAPVSNGIDSAERWEPKQLACHIAWARARPCVSCSQMRGLKCLQCPELGISRPWGKPLKWMVASFRYSVYPVSYTHLDVYKRQHLSWAAAWGNTRGIRSLWSLFSNFLLHVSYDRLSLSLIHI